MPRRSRPRLAASPYSATVAFWIAAFALMWSVVCLAGVPGSAFAQTGDDSGWTVVSARLTADLTAGNGSAAVTVVYALAQTPSATPTTPGRTIPVTLLEIGDASVSRFSVNGGTPMEITTTQGRQRGADIDPPPGEPGQNLVVELTYRVERAVVADGAAIQARIPVLAGPSAPEPGGEGGFEARVRIPTEWRIAEGFPSGLRPDADGVLTVDLQVTPAFVGFRARSDGAWRPGVPLMVDLIMVVILGVFATFGLRHLRRVVA